MRHIFKVLKSSWGIYVDIDAEEVRRSGDMALKKVSDGIYIDFKDVSNYNDDFLSHIVNGIKWVSHEFNVKDGHVIKIKSLNLTFSDFQKEGLFYAAVEWAAKFYNFPPPKYDCVFIKEKNRYEFSH